jgi:hypothetical protein
MLLLGYSIGSLSWFLGLHCLEEHHPGQWSPDLKKAGIHFFRVFCWTLGLYFVVFGFHRYFLWLMVADPEQRVVAILGKTVLFLYLRLFWPGLLVRILPGVRGFFCPQCYEKRSFRFLPVAGSFGNWVTYLCPHCSCLVDGWGNQIFYPKETGITRWSKGWVLVFIGVFLMVGTGLWFAEVLVRTI